MSRPPLAQHASPHQYSKERSPLSYFVSSNSSSQVLSSSPSYNGASHRTSTDDPNALAQLRLENSRLRSDVKSLEQKLRRSNQVHVSTEANLRRVSCEKEEYRHIIATMQDHIDTLESHLYQVLSAPVEVTPTRMAKQQQPKEKNPPSASKGPRRAPSPSIAPGALARHKVAKSLEASAGAAVNCEPNSSSGADIDEVSVLKHKVATLAQRLVTIVKQRQWEEAADVARCVETIDEERQQVIQLARVLMEAAGYPLTHPTDHDEVNGLTSTVQLSSAVVAVQSALANAKLSRARSVQTVERIDHLLQLVRKEIEDTARVVFRVVSASPSSLNFSSPQEDRSSFAVGGDALESGGKYGQPSLRRSVDSSEYVSVDGTPSPNPRGANKTQTIVPPGEEFSILRQRISASAGKHQGTPPIRRTSLEALAMNDCELHEGDRCNASSVGLSPTMIRDLELACNQLRSCFQGLRQASHLCHKAITCATTGRDTTQSSPTRESQSASSHHQLENLLIEFEGDLNKISFSASKSVERIALRLEKVEASHRAEVLALRERLRTTEERLVDSSIVSHQEVTVAKSTSATTGRRALPAPERSPPPRSKSDVSDVRHADVYDTVTIEEYTTEDEGPHRMEGADLDGPRVMQTAANTSVNYGFEEPLSIAEDIQTERIAVEQSSRSSSVNSSRRRLMVSPTE